MEKQRKGCRLVLFPLPLQGHIHPMLQLANILYCKGCSITIVHTNFNCPNPSGNPNFTFCLIPDGLPESTARKKDVVELVSLLNMNCEVPFQDCLAKLLSDSREPVACLIADAVWYFAQSVSERLKLPRIILRTNSICSFLALSALPDLHEKGCLPNPESEEYVQVPGLQALTAKDLPLIKTQDPETLFNSLAVLVDQTRAATGVIWNSFQDLEQVALNTFRQEFSVPIFPIGPLHKLVPGKPSNLPSEGQSSISWLDKQFPNSVIYVSFGTVAAFSDTDFLEIAWGLANSQQPFLWVVRPGLVHGSKWLEPLPNELLEKLGSTGLILKWAPQREVLAHPATGGFLTHCGWNSTLESICEGVPMICQPCFGDQRVNSRYVSDVWKVGLHLENRVERKEIEKAIRRVMEDSEGLQIRERVRNLKEKAERSLRQEGSSYQSLESLICYILSL